MTEEVEFILALAVCELELSFFMQGVSLRARGVVTRTARLHGDVET